MPEYKDLLEEEEEDMGSSKKDTKEEEEGDNIYIYILLTFMGGGLLTPWNVVINSFPFFLSLYEDPHTVATFPFYISSCYSYAGVPVLFFMVFYGNKFSLRIRIVGSFLIQAGIMVALPLISRFSFFIPLVLMVLNGLCTSVLQSSLMGLISSFPPVYSQGFMFGQGIAGALSSYAQLIALATTASGNSDVFASAVAYFASAALVMAGGAVAFLWLERLPAAQVYLRNPPELKITRSSDDDSESIELLGSDGMPGESSETSSPDMTLSKLIQLVWPALAAIFFVFCMTFCVFPGLENAIEYKGQLGGSASAIFNGQTNGRWGVVLLAVFNTFDTVGRFLPGRIICLSRSSLLPVTLLRFAFVPLFYVCAAGISPSIFGDIFALSLVAIFALSNGYVASLVFMLSPSRLEGRSLGDKERTGFLLSLFLNLGITIGAQIALAFT